MMNELGPCESTEPHESHQFILKETPIPGVLFERLIVCPGIEEDSGLRTS